ncbi:transporter substrate-binding domain-containing protein [Paucibacter sp. TC2R-5]|uniref:substrate-binding periplasmic protein n=1 Tax=Paucibacter sp. TC2R-5 TaxID=2893555 RepID=UPI0021E4C3A3|nr:transporter substrate-binding domain-containing protein [Paucibacter sp. TC2R-5]MCV2358266.1 transporter substrate-binding domain-containing protein [Paucibacter sp. TC2R-5]
MAWAAAGAQEFRVDLIQLDPWAKPNPDPGRKGKEAYVGIVADLLNEFERRSGHSTVRTLTPYARVERDLQLGDTDFSIMAWGEARAAYANRGTAFVPLDFGVKARKGVRLRSYEDLRQIVVAAPRGLKVDPRFDVDADVRKELLVDYTQAIRMTIAQRDAKAVAGSLSSLGHIIHKLGLEDEFGDVLVLNTTYLTVAFSKKSPLLASEAQVNAIFKTIVDDGTAKKIYERWMFPTSN